MDTQVMRCVCHRAKASVLNSSEMGRGPGRVGPPGIQTFANFNKIRLAAETRAFASFRLSRRTMYATGLVACRARRQPRCRLALPGLDAIPDKDDRRFAFSFAGQLPCLYKRVARGIMAFSFSF